MDNRDAKTAIITRVNELIRQHTNGLTFDELVVLYTRIAALRRDYDLLSQEEADRASGTKRVSTQGPEIEAMRQTIAEIGVIVDSLEDAARGYYGTENQMAYSRGPAKLIMIEVNRLVAQVLAIDSQEAAVTQHREYPDLIYRAYYLRDVAASILALLDGSTDPSQAQEEDYRKMAAIGKVARDGSKESVAVINDYFDMLRKWKDGRIEQVASLATQRRLYMTHLPYLTPENVEALSSKLYVPEDTETYASMWVEETPGGGGFKSEGVVVSPFIGSPIVDGRRTTTSSMFSGRRQLGAMGHDVEGAGSSEDDDAGGAGDAGDADEALELNGEMFDVNLVDEVDRVWLTESSVVAPHDTLTPMLDLVEYYRVVLDTDLVRDQTAVENLLGTCIAYLDRSGNGGTRRQTPSMGSGAGAGPGAGGEATQHKDLFLVSCLNLVLLRRMAVGQAALPDVSFIVKLFIVNNANIKWIKAHALRLAENADARVAVTGILMSTSMAAEAARNPTRVRACPFDVAHMGEMATWLLSQLHGLNMDTNLMLRVFSHFPTVRHGVMGSLLQNKSEYAMYVMELLVANTGSSERIVSGVNASIGHTTMATGASTQARSEILRFVAATNMYNVYSMRVLALLYPGRLRFMAEALDERMAAADTKLPGLARRILKHFAAEK